MIPGETKAPWTYPVNCIHGLLAPGDDPEEPPAGITELLYALEKYTRGAVPSCVGMTVTLVVDESSLVVTAMDTTIATDRIVASVALPLSALIAAEPGSLIVFYAIRPEAFVEFARMHELIADEFVLDQNLRAPDARATPASMTGLHDLTKVNRAIGMLIDDGRTPEGARAQLRRRARLDRSTLHAAADAIAREHSEGHELSGVR